MWAVISGQFLLGSVTVLDEEWCVGSDSVNLLKSWTNIPTYESIHSPRNVLCLIEPSLPITWLSRRRSNVWELTRWPRLLLATPHCLHVQRLLDMPCRVRTRRSTLCSTSFIWFSLCPLLTVGERELVVALVSCDSLLRCPTPGVYPLLAGVLWNLV